MMLKCARLLCVAAALMVAGCGMPEDWSNPKYVEREMSRGNPRAFHAFQEGDEDLRRALVPALIDVYNSNQNQREALRALLSAPDERAIPVFRNALMRSDDALAVFGARGLAAVGDGSAAPDIAQRMGAITEGNAYVPFIESLVTLRAEGVADAVANVITRPAARIGGVDTVRVGCDLIGGTANPSRAALDAIVFGLVNLQPQPYDDAMRNCELAILAHADAARPSVIQLFTGENTRAMDHIQSLGLSTAAARMRGAMVLARQRNSEANNAIRDWFRQRQVVPTSELGTMNLQQQQAWYDNHGQLFDIATKALAYERNPEDLALLRSLEAPGQGNLLDNFSSWFALSEGAELGLRQSVHAALAGIAGDAEKTLLWQRVESGDIGRGGQQTDTMFHLNTMHIVGRIARRGDLARYDRGVRAQPERWRNEFRTLIGYFLVGEHCGDDIACRGDILRDPSPVMDHPRVAQLLESEEEGTPRTNLRNGIRWAAFTGALWQAVLLDDGDAGCSIAIRQLDHGEVPIRNIAPETLYFCRAFPADAGERLDDWLDRSRALAGAGGVSELRHVVTVLRRQLP